MDSPESELIETTPFKARHTNGQRALLGVSILVTLACFVAAGALIAGKELKESTLNSDFTPPSSEATSTTEAVPESTNPGDTVDTTETTTPETFAPPDPGAKNFLITGSDNNACVDPNSPWAAAADPARPGGERTDTIMMMRVDTETNQAAILSFPRDLWVKIPGRGKSRINASYQPDEPQLLADTIFENFGISADYAIQVDFCAFKTIVDAVGGVAVPFSTPIRDEKVSLHIPTAGCHTFSGDEALAYVRSRYLQFLDEDGTWKSDPFSDLSRISRQQDFLRRALRAALDQGVLDPSVARALITSAQQYVVVSEGFTIDDMLSFVGVLRDVDPAAIQNYQIEASNAVISGQAVLEPRLNGSNMKAILAIFRGEAGLAGAPDQVIDESGTSESTVTNTATTTPGATTTTVAPEEIIKGIVPPDGVEC